MLEAPQPPLASLSLERQKAGLWVAIVVLVAVSLLAFLSIQRLIAASQRVEEAQAETLEVTRFLSHLKDVETGGRGYVISGDIRHLQRQRQGIDSAAATAARLKALGRDDPAVDRATGALLVMASERIAKSRVLVAQRLDREATRRNLAEGLVLMDRIRGQVAAISRAQQERYREESRQLERQAWLTSLALALGVLLCLAAISWLFALRGREVERRRQLEEELRALNIELEDRVQERTAEVKKAIDLLNAVVENIPDMVVLKEPSGDAFRYVLINAAGERLVGRDRSEILGRVERDIFPADEAALVAAANHGVLASGQARTFTDRKLTSATGVRTVETRMVPITAGNESKGLLLGIIRDVTDARDREEQLRQLQRMDAIGRLTGGVAHDFNNLLAIIHGNSELLRLGMAGNADALDMIDDVIGAAGRGAELVKRLLAFARKQHLAPESVDLNARLHDTVGLLQRTLGENMRLNVKTAKKLWPAVVDPTQVDDALVNLAINARDAMPDGGTLTIETQNVRLDDDYASQHAEVHPGDYVMLAVSDTGSGMAPEVAARVFEPFFTTKAEGQGTGLGLSQVFGWVKQSGGHIKVYSELGHGTTVKLYLPRAEGRLAASVPLPEKPPPGGDERILVVEDNPSVRKTVIRQLRDLGYDTVEADSGAQALQLASEGLAFDLLLTDIVMPGGMTGYQLADELRLARPGLKVVFTSGYTELAATAADALRKDPLLSKPYRKHDLGRLLRTVLDEGSGKA